MKLKYIFQDLLVDINKLNDEGYSSEFNDFPLFSTGKNGATCLLNKNIELHISNLSKLMFDNHTFSEARVEYDLYRKIAKQVIVDLFTSHELCSVDGLKKVKDRIDEEVSYIALNFKYHVPVKCQFVDDEPLEIGKVKIININSWIDIIDISKNNRTMYGDTQDNAWKVRLKEAISDNDAQLSGVETYIFPAIEKFDSIVIVESKNLSRSIAKRHALLVAQTVLNMTSLFLGSKAAFFQQITNVDKNNPYMTHSVIEVDGNVYIENSTLTKQCHPIFPNKKIKEATIKQFKKLSAVFENIINGFMLIQDCKHPNLARVWVHALRWYSEGMKENDNAIAITKLASCLDTLSSGGKNKGIQELLCNMYNLQKDDVIFDADGVQPISISKFVKTFYDDMRSRILHGSLNDLLASYEVDRSRLENCARDVLLESALRLHDFDGDDEKDAFKKMKSCDRA